MKEQMSEITGITLNIYDKNEHDVVIKVLSKNRIIFFLVKGFHKLESKNRLNIFIGSISTFEFFNKYNYGDTYLLKKATILNSLELNSNKPILEKLFYLFQELEESSEQFFQTYLNYVKEEDVYFKYYLITYLTFFVLSTKGKKLKTLFCATCNSNKSLYCIDLDEGGILCINHKSKNGIVNKNYVKSFYLLDCSFEEYKKHTSEKSNNFLLFLLFNFLKDK